MNRVIIWFAAILLATPLNAQQQPDTNYQPIIHKPTYAPNQGPLVLVDAGHHNFHTADGRYRPFADLLRRDGYRVDSHLGSFSRESLHDCKILVISNALHLSDVNDWHLPNQSAFSINEIEILEDWVSQGGSLFLIADHMPMGGAAADLAAVFGFECTDGFAIDTTGASPSLFNKEADKLTDNVISKGTRPTELVTQIATFTGQAFQCPEDATSIIDLDDRFVNFLPDSAWVFREHTRRQPAAGWSQGAYKKVEAGRMVLFGEAAMFSAQLAGTHQRKMGMNHPDARQNYLLLLNIIHWLDGLIENQDH